MLQSKEDGLQVSFGARKKSTEKAERLAWEATAKNRLVEHKQENAAKMQKPLTSVAIVVGYTILKEFAKCPKIRSVDVGEFTPGDDSLSKSPLVVEGLELPDTTELLGIIKDAFAKDVPECGRGAKQLIAITGPVVVLFDKLRTNLASTLQGFGTGEQAYVAAPWRWGCTGTFRSCGPEFAWLGGVEVPAEGTRRVVCISFFSALANYQSTVGPNAQPSVATVVDNFANSTADNLALGIQNGEIVCATLVPKQALVLPAGWIACGESVNNEMHFGW